MSSFTLSDGKRIPKLAWGCGSGGLIGSGQMAVALGVLAIESGIHHIDTAQIYLTETETGEAWAKSGIERSKVFITTKISRATKLGPTVDDLRASVEGSIKKLGTIPDLLLIHTPFETPFESNKELWRALEDFVYDGTLKGCSLGVSNFRPQDIQEILGMCRIKPVVNQIEYHPYVLSHLDPLIKIQEDNGILIEAYSPLVPIVKHASGGPLKPVLARIAKAVSERVGKECDTTTVLLLWTIGKGAVAVTTSTNPERIKALSKIEELGPLKPEEMAEIETTGRKIYYRFYKGHMTTDFPTPDLPEDL